MNCNRQSFSSHSFAAAFHQNRPAPACLHACMICRKACDESYCDSDGNLVAGGNLVAAESSVVACLVEENPS